MHSTAVSAAVTATLPISGHGHSQNESCSTQSMTNTSGLSQQHTRAQTS